MLLEENGCHVASLQPNPMSDVAVNDDRLTVNHIYRESLSQFAKIRVHYLDVQDECLTGECRLTAGGNPLIALALIDDNIWKNREDGVFRLGHVESLIAASICHISRYSNGGAVLMTLTSD